MIIIRNKIGAPNENDSHLAYRLDIIVDAWLDIIVDAC